MSPYIHYEYETSSMAERKRDNLYGGDDVHYCRRVPGGS